MAASTPLCESTTNELRDSIENINFAAREGFNKIEAIATAIKLMLEREDRQDYLVAIAHLITTIRHQAAESKDCVETEVRAAGIHPIGVAEIKIMFPGGIDGHLKGVH